MASSSSPSPNHHTPNPTFPPTTPFHTGFDPNSSHPNTTFVHADPSTFRAVVQRLTGAPSSGDIGRRRPAFKLPTHARINLENIKLNSNNNNGTYCTSTNTTSTLHSPNNSYSAKNHMVSPVSPLEYISAARGSPTTPLEEEERAIADKGFYLHPSPLSTPRGSDPPELLPLFPLHSPRDHN